MINVNALRGEMAENGITGEQMAKFIGITPKTFYKKMKDGIFGSDEIQIMIDHMTLTHDPMDIFFAK